MEFTAKHTYKVTEINNAKFSIHLKIINAFDL